MKKKEKKVKKIEMSILCGIISLQKRNIFFLLEPYEDDEANIEGIKEANDFLNEELSSGKGETIVVKWAICRALSKLRFT